MGLDYMLAGIAWPARRSPDWDAIREAAVDLPAELAERIDDAHQLWELGADTPEEQREAASGELCQAVDLLRNALTSGARHLTLIEVDGSTVLLDGGISSGEEPTPTWYWTETLAESGLLGEPLTRYAETPPPIAGLHFDTPLPEVVAPIGRPPRLVVVAFPPNPDWEAATAAIAESERQLLERLAEVVSGGYSRRAARLHVNDTTLLLGDRADPTGVLRAIEAYQRSGALAAAGGRVLSDLRLSMSTDERPGDAP